MDERGNRSQTGWSFRRERGHGSDPSHQCENLRRHGCRALRRRGAGRREPRPRRAQGRAAAARARRRRARRWRRRDAHARHGRVARASVVGVGDRPRHHGEIPAARGASSHHREERPHHARLRLHERLFGGLARHAVRDRDPRRDRRRLDSGTAPQGLDHGARAVALLRHAGGARQGSRPRARGDARLHQGERRDGARFGEAAAVERRQFRAERLAETALRGGRGEGRGRAGARNPAFGLPATRKRRRR